MQTPDELLAELGEWQSNLLFLGNDGRQLFGDARLSVFRAPDDWAVFVELPHYQDLGLYFSNWIGFAGACEGDIYNSPQVGALEMSNALKETADSPLHEDCHWVGDRAAFSIVVRGARHDFRPSAADYNAAGITFSDDATGADSIKPSQLLRFVSHHLNHPLLARESELRTILLPEVREEMTLWLQTALWRHPYFMLDPGDEEDEMLAHDFIPNLACWQVLARAIACGELSEWHAQDAATFNTSWRALEAINRENSRLSGF